jgi:uncharacterized protein (DUF58 family)
MSESAPSPEALLRQLEWTVIHRLDGLLQGDYRTLFRGFGLDIADLREYQPQDDVRYIDWNVTARLQEPHVREYYEDREVTAWFLLDLSPSIDFGSFQIKKRQMLEQFVAVISRLLTRNGNRVGAILYTGKVDKVIPARSSRVHILHIMKAIEASPQLDQAPETNLEDFLRASAQIIKRRSLVFVVSDFISTPGWERQMALLNQRHEMIGIRLFDPLELELPDLGLLMVQDSETGEQLFVDTHDRGFRVRFARAAERREAELRAAFSQAGVDILELSTTDDLVDAILRFVDLRKQRSMLTSGGSPPSHLEGSHDVPVA